MVWMWMCVPVCVWGVRLCDVYVHMRGFCACVFVSVHGEPG